MTTNTAVTASITHLLSIMTNGRETTRQRIGAAKSLLAYEAPAEVVEKTKKFLTAVLEDRAKYRTDTRLEAAELLRKAEARKVQMRAVGAEVSPQWQETMRRLRVAKRRLKLMDLDLWPAPSGWCDDLLSRDNEPVEPQTDAGVTDITPTGQ